MDDPDANSTQLPVDYHGAASLQAAMQVPIDVCLGPTGPLLRKLHSLTDPGHTQLDLLSAARKKRKDWLSACISFSFVCGKEDWRGADEIRLLRDGLTVVCLSLKNLSEDKDVCSTANWWVNIVRELCYDAEDYLDEVISGTAAYHDYLVLLDRAKDASERLERFAWSPATIKPDCGDGGVSHLTPQLSLELPMPISVYVNTAGRRLVVEPPNNFIEQLALNDGQKQLKVIPIFGSAGVGKTAVARAVYRNYRWEFQCRAFIGVSRHPDMRRFLASLVSQIKAPLPHSFLDVPELIDAIREHLQGKRYFIIIDDLWTASVWDIIRRSFPHGDYCSRIITTTRIYDVALACCDYYSEYIYRMSPLNDDESRNLFFIRVSGSEDSCRADVKEISNEIIKKCGGIPLAILNIASMLASKPNIVNEEWKHIQEYLSSTSDGMKDVLNLIYSCLPPRLRTCLLYLSMYPEGEVIKKDELVKQWVAEGFLCAVEGQDAEEIAEGHFDELVSRGVIQAVDTNHNGEVLSCRVHQMLLDFIRYKSMEENFVIAVESFQSTLALPEKVRRLSVQFGGVEISDLPKSIIMSQVRSLFFCGFLQCVASIVDYKLLRILFLRIWGEKEENRYKLTRIGELIRLRYLKIECNITVDLPDKIEGLRYLETLDIDARLSAPLSDIVHFGKLLHLLLPSKSNLPHGVGHMTSLRSLGYFDLGSNSEDNVIDLGRLTNLQDLRLTFCTEEPAENLEKKLQLLSSIFEKLSVLQSITLTPAAGSSQVNIPHDDARAASIPCDSFSVISIAPDMLLRRIELSWRCCIFFRLPKWLGELSKLRILKIAVRGLSMEDVDILKGQRALTALSLHLQTKPEKQIVFGKGGFSVLTYFKFTCTVPLLKFEADAMPNLENLKLGFNAPTVDEQGTTPIIINHLSGLKKISAKIGCGSADARSGLSNVINNDRRNPTVQFVGTSHYGGDGGMVRIEPGDTSITRAPDTHPVKSMLVDPAPIPPSRWVILRRALLFIVSDDPNEGIVEMWGPDKDDNTDLLKHINNSFLEQSLFDFVIFVPSPRDCSVTNIQSKIISRLNMRHDGNEATRATRIREQLENKNFLLIVDDLRQNLDLGAVGIPYPLGFVGEKKRKVVITSLSKYRSIHNLMGVNKDIELPILQEEEARELFRQSINYQGGLYSDPNIGAYATDLVHAINGLPSELVRYGRLMRGTTDASSWKVARDDAASKFSSSPLICASTSDEVIRFDPPELCFPMVPDKTVLSSIKIINTTESYVSFGIGFTGELAGRYVFSKINSILPPRSSECIAVRRYEKERAVEKMQFNEELYVGYAIVAEDIKACDLDANDYTQWKKLHIVGKKINSCTSNELIQFEPPELSFPCLSKTSLSWVNIVNHTDCHIGFNTWWYKDNVASYAIEQRRGILPPRSTRRMVVQRVPKEKGEIEESESSSEEHKFFVWNMIVSEGVEASSLLDYASDEESTELPLVCKKISPCTSDELIRLDHPELRFTISQNKTALSSINMVNVTDYYVGFRLFNGDTNALYYEPNPELGVLAPRSAQRVLVSRPIDQKEPEEDMQYNNKFYMWNAIVSEGIRASDLGCFMCKKKEQSNELPIILNKVTSSTSVELIKLEPPEVCFPFLPSKRLLSSVKIVNITDYHIGFNTAVEETNVASYITEPKCGVLRPWSTQELVVSRVSKDETPELVDLQCADKYFVWSGFVTEDVNASDLITWMPITERKEFPIVFAKASSNELIQFDPPELCLPLLLNQRVLSSAKIVNITDQYISFRICTKKNNSARYYANPSEGILPPLSTQLLLVTRIAEEKELEDTQCTDKFFVWNVIVTEDFKASDVIDNMSETKCTELPIVLTKTSSTTSDELIQLDPPELHLPLLSNKKVLSSIKIVNLTDYSVGFNTYSRPTNAAWYHTEPPRGILPPRSTRKLMVTREEKEDALQDKHFNDKYFVWKSIVSEGVKDSDLSDYMADQESLELPIILDKISSSISGELIQFDPAEICIPLLLNKTVFFSVNVINITDFYVAFNAYWFQRIAPRDRRSKEEGILSPRSSKKITLGWLTAENELEDMEANGGYFVWNRVVTDRVESGDIISYMDEEESKKVPLIPKKASPCTADGLIRFDPPQLSLPFIPNKPLVFSVNLVNNMDYCVAFRGYHQKSNVGLYYMKPQTGVMPPRSTQRLVVKMVPRIEEQHDMHCADKFFLWCNLVSEGVQAGDFDTFHEGIKELPIVYNKTSLCASDELIQFDPPQLPFPFVSNKRVPMQHLSKGMFKITNVTDHIVGFSLRSPKDNYARYKMEPGEGILPPQSTQTIEVRRILNGNQTEDMQCKDKIFVWNEIVTEAVEVSDVRGYRTNNDKELPVVLTMPGESSSR